MIALPALFGMIAGGLGMLALLVAILFFLTFGDVWASAALIAAEMRAGATLAEAEQSVAPFPFAGFCTQPGGDQGFEITEADHIFGDLSYSTVSVSCILPADSALFLFVPRDQDLEFSRTFFTTGQLPAGCSQAGACS